MSKLREKLPEILIEGLFVVFAILLALAADEWSENRQNREVAERALQGIETEMLRNREELARSHGPNQLLLEQLTAVVSDDQPVTSVDFMFDYSLLSDAAWETAQVTQAIHFADYELVQQIARMYDLQELFVEGQRGVVEQMSGMVGGLRDNPEQFAGAIMGRLGILMNVEAGFMAVLDTMIVQMEQR